MASNLKGITLEIGGNTAPLDKALKGVNEKSRDLQSELYKVNNLLKLDPTNTELVSQKQKILGDMIMNTGDKLGTLKIAEKQAQEQFAKGKISEEQYRELQREVIGTENKLKSLEKQARETNGALSSDQAVSNLKNMGKAALVTGAAVGAAFIAIGNEAMNVADELKKQSDITGISTDRLQELTYVGNQLGVSLDTITGAQAKVTKSMASAKDGTGAQADAFKALGISVVDGNGQLRDSKVVMEETITALGTMTNETERDAMAQQIFGKSAMELNPLIKAGGVEIAKLTDEARTNGAIMSEDAVNGLDEFGDSIDGAKQSIVSMIGEALAKLMPYIKAMIKGFADLWAWKDKNQTLFTVIMIAVATLTTAIIAYNVAMAWGTITTWAAATATTAFGAALAFVTSPVTLVVLAIGALIAVGVLLWKNWDYIGVKAKEIFGAIGSFVGNIFKGIGNGFIDMVNFLIGGINFLIKGWLSPFNLLIKGWNATLGGLIGKIPEIKVTIGEIPHFDVGTRFLPQDMLIQAHKGEMIVPRSENPYANSGGVTMPGMSPKEFAIALREELERADIKARISKSNFEDAFAKEYFKATKT